MHMFCLLPLLVATCMLCIDRFDCLLIGSLIVFYTCKWIKAYCLYGSLYM